MGSSIGLQLYGDRNLLATPVNLASWWTEVGAATSWSYEISPSGQPRYRNKEEK